MPDHERNDTTDRLPALFIGHGSPMNALEENRWTQAWREVGSALPRPRAIVAISAHWYIQATAITTMARPATIHDFFGFPPELFAYDYPAPGLPELADEIAEVVKPTWIGHDVDSWGLDHGTWSVLTHLFPEADVPVVQLSINALREPSYHVELGAALAPLRDRGVLFVASGNQVHNLGLMNPARSEQAFPWAAEYDEAVTTTLAEDPARVVELFDHPHHGLAHPSVDHLLPLFYLAGLAAAAGTATELITEGSIYGSLSMASHRLT